MKRKTDKKLELTRTRIVALGMDQLGQAVGGGLTDHCVVKQHAGTPTRACMDEGC